MKIKAGQTYIAREDMTRRKQNRTITILGTKLDALDRVNVESYNERTGVRLRRWIKAKHLLSSKYFLVEKHGPTQPYVALVLCPPAAEANMAGAAPIDADASRAFAATVPAGFKAEELRP